MSELSLIYIAHEFPAKTQTFVWTELGMVRAEGVDARAYVLNHAADDPPAWVWSLRSLRTMDSIVPLLQTVMAGISAFAEIARVFSLPPRGVGSRLRQAKALVHAVSLAAQVRRARLQRVHLHAHFLGRTLDTLCFAQILLQDRSVRASAVGHAADAVAPLSEDRLRQQIDRLDFVACASEFVRARIARLAPGASTELVHAGVPSASRLAAVSRSNPGMLRICSVGRLVEKKGFRVALDAVRALQDCGASFHWSFVGDGPLETALQTAAVELGVEGSVTWFGHQTNDFVRDLVAGSTDVFVLPCVQAPDGDVDGIPVALMEAMSLGVPVVSTSIGGIGELIEDQESGFLCAPEEVDELTGVLLMLAASPEERIRIGEAGRKRVTELFNDRTEALKLIARVKRTWADNPLEPASSA